MRQTHGTGRADAPEAWETVSFTNDAGAFNLVHVGYWHDPNTHAAWVLNPPLAAWSFGLVRMGGGVVVVPGTELAVGAADLLAKGTSLLMMLPTTISGTITNARRKNVDLVAGTVIGITAAICAPFGTATAVALTPLTASALFSGFLVLVAVLVVRRSRPRHTSKPRSCRTVGSESVKCVHVCGSARPTRMSSE